MTSQSVTLAQGECDVCGMPGIVGMNCSDPDCRGTVKDLQLAGKVRNPILADDEDSDDDRYDKDLLDKEDETLSLEDLEEEEDKEDDEADDDLI